VLRSARPVGIELAGEIVSVCAQAGHPARCRADLLPGDYDLALRVELARQLEERGVELLLAAH